MVLQVTESRPHCLGEDAGLCPTDGLPAASYPVLELILTILTKWSPPVYITLGVFGNIISLLISLKGHNRKISTCVYMCGLAIMDTLVLLEQLIHVVFVSHRVYEPIQDTNEFVM
jgi:hypothetical protein